MVSEYKPLKKEDLHIDETTKNLRVDVESGISGQTVIAEISGQVVDVSDREVRKLGAIYGADEGFVVRVPLVDASRYVHTVVESGKVDAVVTGSVLADISGKVVRAEQYGTWPVKVSGETVFTNISGQVIDVSGQTVIADALVHPGYATLWSGAVVSPGDNVGIETQSYRDKTLFIHSHSGEMTFKTSLYDGYDWYEMERKSFSGDMVWSVDHICHSVNLQALSGGMVTARMRMLRY